MCFLFNKLYRRTVSIGSWSCGPISEMTPSCGQTLLLPPPPAPRQSLRIPGLYAGLVVGGGVIIFQVLMKC